MASAEDEFGDEYFDDLLDEDLEELERKAILSTQAASASRYQHSSTDAGHYQQRTLFEGDSFATEFGDSDDEVINAAEPGQSQTLLAAQEAARVKQAQNSHTDVGQASSTAGNIRRTDFARTTSNLPYRPSSQTKSAERVGPAQNRLEAVSGGYDQPEVSYDDLQDQIQQLMLERDKLQQALKDANRQVFTKSGEIAVVRANNDRIVRERELKISELEQELRSAGEKHTIEIEQAKREQEQLATENQFADHDRIIERARQRKPTQRANQDVIVTRHKPLQTTVNSTPRRNRQTVFGDGFSFQERSPARPSPQSRSTTPIAAEKKRKRILESPIKRGDVSNEDENDYDMGFADDEGTKEVEDASNEELDRSPDLRYEILQNFLDHRMDWDQERTIEALAKFHFPSDSTLSLATIIYDEIANLGNTETGENFAIALCSLVVSLWKRCISEKYYDPLSHIIDQAIDLISFSPETASPLMDELVPIAQSTADVTIVARFKRFRRAQTDKPESEASEESPDIPTENCLEILLLVAESVGHRDFENIARFWKLVRFDFVSMLLRSSQDPAHVHLTARLVSYSCQEESIGSIIDPSRPRPSQDQTTFNQSKSEEHLIDRLTSMLLESPKPLTDKAAPYDGRTICDMRLSILATISTFAKYRYSAKLVANHPLAIARLVRCMSDGFHNALESSTATNSTLKPHINIVSEATRLVHHFVNAFDDVDINFKLAKILGGPHIYLVVLSRIVFSEGAIYGEEIDEDVQDCAQSLLEDFVSPEEGDMLMEMAGAGGGQGQ